MALYDRLSSITCFSFICFLEKSSSINIRKYAARGLTVTVRCVFKFYLRVLFFCCLERACGFRLSSMRHVVGLAPCDALSSTTPVAGFCCLERGGGSRLDSMVVRIVVGLTPLYDAASRSFRLIFPAASRRRAASRRILCSRGLPPRNVV